MNTDSMIKMNITQTLVFVDLHYRVEKNSFLQICGHLPRPNMDPGFESQSKLKEGFFSHIKIVFKLLIKEEEQSTCSAKWKDS